MKADSDGSWAVALAISPDRAVLDPAGARLVVQLLDNYVRNERLISPAAQRLRAVLVRVASSGGQADTETRVPDTPWAHDEIGTAEAAKVLGLSIRHASRLAAADAFGESRVVGGRRLVSRAEVVAYRVERAHRSTD